MYRTELSTTDEEWLLFTDLDGTLLHHLHYGYAAARPLLQRLERLGIRCHIASSKTYAESIRYYREWRVHRPMVLENGAVIAWPEGDGYHLQTFDVDYTEIRSGLRRIRDRVGWTVEGFGDWSPERIAELTGLTSLDAEQAACRIASEPVLWGDDPRELEQFRTALSREGLQLIRGGRFHHIMGAGNKAEGVALIKAWYSARGVAPLRTLALGDSENDRGMLEAADHAIVVRRHDGTHLNVARSGPTYYAEATAPEGWVEAVQNWLDS